MEKGDYVIMIKFPESNKHAEDYCNHHGLYIGCVCEIMQINRYLVILRNQETTGYNLVDLGVDFLYNHFKKEFRTKNLEKLGI